MIVPWLPDGYTTTLDGRGEVFYRSFRHADRSRPTVLLLHGWTACADTQFFTAYESIAKHYSILAIDHRGHGRGMRDTFSLEACADDAAALVDQLGVGPVIAVGYSMGGPIAALLTRRHPHIVSAIFMQATAMEWSATRLERAQWRFAGVLGLWMRSRWQRRTLRVVLRRLRNEQPALDPYLMWLEGEVVRNDPVGLLEAARALRHYDARPFAGELAKPAASLITTADRLVRPRKQRQLAEALGATVRELHADHLATMLNGEQYAALTLELLALLEATVVVPATV
jgi:pimeloyl-ACP methyl ester carboxylesterase